MRYLLFGGFMFALGIAAGSILRGLISREKLRREVLRREANNAPKEVVERLYKEL